MIPGMEATLLGDTLMYGRCVALTVITDPPGGEQVRRTLRIDPECYQVLADGRPDVQHIPDCSCDRPWHPAHGPCPAPAAALPAALEAELHSGEPVPTVLAALRRLRERRPSALMVRVTSLNLALLAEALLELGVTFPAAGRNSDRRG